MPKDANRLGRDGLLCLTDSTFSGDSTFWVSFGYIDSVSGASDEKLLVSVPDDAGHWQELVEVSDYREYACRVAKEGKHPIVPGRGYWESVSMKPRAEFE